MMYQRNRVLFINMHVLTQPEYNNIIMIKNLNDNCSSHTWNEYDDVFDKQLEKLGVEKLFSDEPEHVTRELIDYIEDWGKRTNEKYDQISCTQFWKNMVVSLFIILIFRIDIQFMMKTFAL